MKIVIIGNGVAGMEAALVVRAREPQWDITIISEESDHFFSRTALMWVLSGQLSHQCIEPLERDVYERMDFRRVRARATGIDPVHRVVNVAGHDDVAYDRLLIASGSRPRAAPWPGADCAGVGYFVTHQDLAWLESELHGGPGRGGLPPRPDAHLPHSHVSSPYWKREVSRPSRGHAPRNVAVVGGGLIGIEAVEILLAAGHRPHFFIREEYFWPMALDAAESKWVAERLRDHGAIVHLDESVTRLEGDKHLQRIITDQSEYECDVLVVAIGVVPNTEWLAGIDLDKLGGIVVDEHLQTSAKGVYAAGDCASVRWLHGAKMPEQLWYTARDQGRVAGRGLLGDTARYQRGHWYNSAKLMDIEYTTAGLVNMNVEHEKNWFYEERGAVRSTNRIVLSADRVVGFNFLGRRWDHEVLIRFIEEHRSLEYVLAHLHEASFDTELVDPLRIPAHREMSGPAPSPIREPISPPVV